MDENTEKRFMDKVDLIYERSLQLPCAVHEEKFEGIKSKINRLWYFVGAIGLSLIGLGIAKIKGG